MASLEKDKFFYDLIMQGRFIINDDATEVLFDNKPKRFYKIYANSKHRLKDGEDYCANYHDGIYHDRKIILLQRLVYMYHTKELIPKGCQITHKDVNKHNNRFDNLLCLSVSEHQNYLSTIGYKREITTKESENRRQRAIINNPKTKLTLKQVEHYRCQYHQQRMTVNAIMIDSGMQRRSVENMLQFKSYYFDPITGEIDKELSNYYTSKDAKPYKRVVTTPRKPRELKVKVVKEDKVVEKKVCNLTKPKSKSKESIIANVKPMKTPLSFYDGLELIRLREKYNWKTPRIAREVHVGEKTVEKHMNITQFFIDIFPNYSFLNNEKKVELFEKFRNKYQDEFINNATPDIKPYSFRMLISLSTNVLRQIYTDYRDNELSLEEIEEKHNCSELDVKFGIIEYDRYLRPKHERRITPEQFNHVYNN